ncbi:MAG: hypothetical protein WCP14_01985 [bacterium]
MTPERLSNDEAYKEGLVVKKIAEAIASDRNVTLPSTEDYSRAEGFFTKHRENDPKGSQDSIDQINEANEMTRDIEKEKAEIIPVMQSLIAEASISVKQAMEKIVPDIAADFSADLFEIVDGEVIEKKESDSRSTETKDLQKILKDEFEFTMYLEPGKDYVFATTSFVEDGKAYMTYADVKKNMQEFSYQFESPEITAIHTPEQIRQMKLLDVSHTLSHEYIHLESKPELVTDPEEKDRLAKVIIANFERQLINSFIKNNNHYKQNAEFKTRVENFYKERLLKPDGTLKDGYAVKILGGRIRIDNSEGDTVMMTGYEINEEMTELTNEGIYREVSMMDPDYDKFMTDYYMSETRKQRRKSAIQIGGKSSHSVENIVDPEEAEALLKLLSEKEGADLTASGPNFAKIFTSGEFIRLLLKHGMEDIIR